MAPQNPYILIMYFITYPEYTIYRSGYWGNSYITLHVFIGYPKLKLQS